MPLELIQSNRSEYFLKLEEFFNEKVNKEVHSEKVNSNLSTTKDGEYNLREFKETSLWTVHTFHIHFEYVEIVGQFLKNNGSSCGY